MDNFDNNNFDIDLYNHYLVLAKKSFPDVDINLLEYSTACHLIYDINGIKRPDENHPDFIKANEKIKELLLLSKNQAKASESLNEANNETE